MRTRFDQLVKGLLHDTLSPVGTVRNQYEVTADVKAVDTWFQPDPTRVAERERLGFFLNWMTQTACLFEAFHNTPGIDDVRGCVCKQLLVNQRATREARAQHLAAPAFPRLWVLSSGRPESVIESYGLLPIAGLPPAFLERREVDAWGVVVLRELPRERDTLLLRLMGAGAVLREAHAELARLPADAWERTVAMPLLIALRFEIPHPSTEDEKEYLMSTQELYEQWMQQVETKGVERGVKQGAKQMLITVYKARFGTMPPDVVAAIEAMHDTATLSRWAELISTRSADEIAASVRVGSTPLS